MTDRSNETPLAYVNIGVIEAERGTVSDEMGLFSLDLKDLPPEAVLRFSYIGYASKDFTVGEIVKHGNAPLSVGLNPITIQMDRVIVHPREYKEVVKGNPNPPGFMNAGFSNDSLGYEIGILVKVRKRPTQIKVLNLHNLATSYDSVFYRLNVYEMEGREPVRSALNEPIYIQLTKTDLRTEISVDLTPYNIMVHDDFVITLEYVRELGEGRLSFGAGMANGWTYYRRTSQGRWYRSPIGIGMSVLIRYAK